MPIYLGLDCGGSSCRALAADASGAIVFRGQSGPANIASTERSQLILNLGKALKGCPRPDTVCGCFAGLLTDEDQESALSVLEPMAPGATIRVLPDYAAAHAAADGADVSVVAGTGSVICSFLEGTWRKSGGRGYLLGDAGSAFRYGRQALLHYLNSNEPPASLREAVLNAFGSHDRDAVVAAVYRGKSPGRSLAGLARAFAQDVLAGEPYAMKFLVSESNDLADLLAGHIEKWFTGASRVGVSLAGGLWKVSNVYEKAFRESTGEMAGRRKVSLTLLKAPPVTGALKLAMRIEHEH